MDRMSSGADVIVPPRKPARGALLSVALGRTESSEWALDAKLREQVNTDASRRAREKGRKFFEVRDANGKVLNVGSV